MTPELHNPSHIASMVSNEPLLLGPVYARAFFYVLAGQLGITRLTNTVSDVALGAEQMVESLTFFGGDEEMGPKPTRSYQIIDDIAVLPVSGTLTSKTRLPQPYSGMMEYSGIIARLQQAINGPDVDGILLDADTPGGMVTGASDYADIIAHMRDIRPTRALTNGMNCSAGQLIASVASRRLMTQTARTGSIGVAVAHSDYGTAPKTNGVEVTLVYSSDHKTDGNPYEKLSKEVRADFQARIDTTRQIFAEKVASYTGTPIQAVLSTEAAVLSGQESVDNGLAEQLVNNMDVLSVMHGIINKRTMVSREGNMKGTIASADTIQPAVFTDQTVTTVDVPAVVVTDSAVDAAVDISSQVTTAVATENGCITGTLNYEEAKGRESQARVLMEMPEMTAESAQRILIAAPLSVQVRMDTALDHLMETTPGIVTTGNASTKVSNDLLNTPA